MLDFHWGSLSTIIFQEVELLLEFQGQIPSSFKSGGLFATLINRLQWMKKAAEIIYAPCKHERFSLSDAEEALAECQVS